MDLLSSIPSDVLRHARRVDFEVPFPHCNKAVEELLKRTVLLEGKRLRPLLSYLMGNLFGLPCERVKLYADSIELVHAASLSHDDVIDNATIRRGAPSINTMGNKRAILAGDYLLSHVIANLARHGRWELLEEMALVVSSLARGEWLQMETLNLPLPSRETLEEIARLKTASVITWCAVAPAILAELPDNLVEYCRRFGTHLGIAFQQIDDILDSSKGRETGKDRHQDIKNGLLNSVSLEWVLTDQELQKRVLQGEPLPREAPEEFALRVRENAGRRLQQCRELLAVIAAELPPEKNEKKRRAALNSLHFFLNYLGKRSS